MSCCDSQNPVTKDLEAVVKKMVEDSIDSAFNENAAFLNESIRLNMQDSLNDTIQNIDRKIFHLRTDLKITTQTVNDHIKNHIFMVKKVHAPKNWIARLSSFFIKQLSPS